MKSIFSNYSYTYGDRTDVGMQRRKNEDRIIVVPEFGFFGVTDGMGGLTHGEETAIIVASSMQEEVERFLNESGIGLSVQQAADFLKQTIIKISESIYYSSNRFGKFDFGATLTCVFLIGDCAVFGNLGDSRAYLIRKNGSSENIIQITTDHNLANQLVEEGIITKEEAKYHDSSLQLLRFMGIKPPTEPETHIVKLSEGDVILLCSDGLHDMLFDNEILKIVRENQSIEDAVQALIGEANDSGGTDNITVVLIELS